MRNFKTILGIETTFDETAVAVVQNTDNGLAILSNVLSSSSEIQIKYGGVVPEQAAREQLKAIIPVTLEALAQAFPKLPISDIRNLISEIDAIAVASGPGLIGSLLVGVETAKTLSLIFNKPLISINHLEAHFYANWITERGVAAREAPMSARSELVSEDIDWSFELTGPRALDVPHFRALGLLVSGGHTDLVLFINHGKYQYLGGTLDDAAGECFDKCARVLGLPYPGGPLLSELAKKGRAGKFKLPRPMKNSHNFNFSFSGLKTAVINLQPQIKTIQDKTDLALEIEETITDSLVNKSVTAAKKYNIEHIMISGGVSANSKLREKLTKELNKNLPHATLSIPPLNLCTDNGVIIAAAAFFTGKQTDPLVLQANPSLGLKNLI